MAGDCLGRYYEGHYDPDIGKLLNKIDITNKTHSISNLIFTDDTALTRAVCQSLIEKNGFDVVHMAETLSATCLSQPMRGYAYTAIDLFNNLKDFKDENTLETNCYKPAFQFYNGQGSLGNGCAMRASPLALYTFKKSKIEAYLGIIMATALTHSHYLGIIGALLQCKAIRTALKHEHSGQANQDLNSFVNQFIQKLVDFLQDIETNLLNYQEKAYSNENFNDICTNMRQYLNELILYQKQNSDQVDNSYSHYLKRIQGLIIDCQNGQFIDLFELHHNYISCGVRALESIPAAILAFSIAINPKCEHEVDQKLGVKNSFELYGLIERVIFYAIRLGGDTDTIASMAGSIAGAFAGVNATNIPFVLLECEGAQDLLNYGSKLATI